MPTQWIPCDTPEGFEVVAYTCGKFIVACKRIPTGFAWNVFRRTDAGPEKFGRTFHQHVTPAVLEDRDIRHALQTADKEIAFHARG
jgi:hypothetical protein